MVPTTITSSATIVTTSIISGTEVETTETTNTPFYITLGVNTVTSYQTIVVPVSQTGPPKSDDPITVFGVTTEGGEVNTIIETQAPVTQILTDERGGVITQEFTPPPETHITTVGGVTATEVVVLTPTAFTSPVTVSVESTIGAQTITVVNDPTPKTIVTSKDGQLVTLVTTIAAQTQVKVVGGTVTTVAVLSTPGAGLQAVTVDVVTTVGGTPVTVIETQSPQTIVTSSDGSLVTLVTTPPPKTVVSTIGGTVTTVAVVSSITGFLPITYTLTTEVDGKLTTETLVTTPTAGGPITLSFAYTISGTVSTSVETFAPTTIVTQISGKLTTIVSTPAPSTHLSTVPLSTRTWTSVSTPGVSATTAGQAFATYLVKTETPWTLTTTDYFVSTFLPTLLAVMLVIPLRIIDLNAKAYQPFSALAKDGGSPGFEAMTLQYSGMMGFITPVVNLLHGHPVPFITTIAVGCASFMVPLSAEAFNPKLHGHCQQLVVKGCAPSLGVSTLPANVLIGVIVLLILLLLLLIFFTSRWVTGVTANPWTIAGMASLARNSDVRIRRSGDKGVRQSVADKQYGLGFFDDGHGREEYGIVLTDESGRVLQDESDGASSMQESEGSVSGLKVNERPTPLMTLRAWWRLLFVVYLVGLMVVILYYHLTLMQFSIFNTFMYSHSFGVRFLFAILGVVITFCWQSFFIGTSNPSSLPFTLHHRARQLTLLRISRRQCHDTLPTDG
jgi:hypothetical protein